MDIAGLYRAQAPGYLAGLTEVDQRFEPVYELTLQSAQVDSRSGHDLVSLRELNASIPPQRPGDRARPVRPGAPDGAGEL